MSLPEGCCKKRIFIPFLTIIEDYGGSKPLPYGISGELFVGRGACSRRLFQILIRVILQSLLLQIVYNFSALRWYASIAKIF